MKLISDQEQSELYEDAMKLVKKGHSSLTQLFIEHIFSHETHFSYLHNNDRWYVSKYNESHYIHYRFIYTDATVTLKFFILPHGDKPQFIPFS